MNKQRGFTLIEIAIVLVIIGLLLGGVLKGQELITSARVRNLIAQQDGTKAAYFGFVDRFRSLPGDYAAAVANINGTAAFGNGNGQIEAAATPVNVSVVAEDIAVWDHLSKSGFITGSYTHSAGAYTAANAAVNPYTAFMVMRFDAVYGDNSVTPGARHNLKTGQQLPADLLAEIDRKVDDGLPLTGTFRFSAGAGAGTAPTLALCVVPVAGSTPAQWLVIGSVEPNCGGTTLF